MTILSKPEQDEIKTRRSVSEENANGLFVLSRAIARREIHRNGKNVGGWKIDFPEQNSARHMRIVALIIRRHTTFIAPENERAFPGHKAVIRFRSQQIIEALRCVSAREA